MIFDVLERDLLAQMHGMLHTEHVVIAGGATTPEAFRDELEGAATRYNNCGELRLPWMRWAAQKTAEQAYREAMARRKDPTHVETLKKLQGELDSEAKRISDAVSQEVEIRKAATVHAKDLQKKMRKRHGRLSRRKPRTSR